MADISFQEEQQLAARPVAARTPKGIAGLLIKHGIAKDEKGASVVMLGIIIACVAIIVLVLILPGAQSTRLSEEEQRLLERTTPLPGSQ